MRPFCLIAFALVALCTCLGAAEPTTIDQLRADNQKLRDDLTAMRRQIADLSAAVRRLEAEVSALRAAAGAQPPVAGARATRELVIRVQPGGWGDADAADIQKVLDSAGAELWRHFTDRRLEPILVSHGGEGPTALYGRGPGGEYRLKLDVKDRYWCQFAYQFAHELCHVLSNYDSKTGRHNQWFDESLCEMASMFVVGRMAETWKTSPPYRSWRSYSPSLKKYADDLKGKKERQLPPGVTLAAWYRDNAKALRADPYLRDKNAIVAMQLLALFEKSPQSWEAVTWLNQGGLDADESFASYLASWHRHAPDRHKPFVAEVMAMFGIEPRQE